MKVGSSGVSRYPFEFRSPTWGGIGFEAPDVGPHGFTQRASYTVPAGRIATISMAYATCKRRTAPGAQGMFLACVIDPDGRTALQAWSFGINIGDGESLVADPTVVIFESNNIIIGTEDNSVGGTVDYYIDVSILEHGV